MEQNRETEKKKYTARDRTRILLYLLSGSKRFFALGVVCSMLVSLFNLLNPRIIGYTVDYVLEDTAGGATGPLQEILAFFGGASFLRSNLFVIALLVTAVALFSALFRFLLQFFLAIGVEKFLKRTRDRVFSHILRLPFSWHSENHTGDIIQRCTSDVETIRNFLSEQMISLFRISILIVFALFFMISIHPMLTLAAAAFVPVIIGYSLFFHNRIGSQFLRADEEEGRLSAIAQENLTGVRVVRAFGREVYERERFEKQNSGYTKLWIRIMMLLSAFWASGDLISNLQLLTVMVFGSVLAVQGQLSAGAYISFVFYNSLLSWPVRELGRIISDMSKAGVSIDRIAYILDSEPEKDEEDAAQPELTGDITFSHVTYHYENAPTAPGVLEDVSFTVKAGTTVGILGATGSGKSTLMYLLDRLYDLPEGGGTISIGGTDIRRIRREHLRRNIGMVLQEPFLFSRTLEENIAITGRTEDKKLIRKRVREAAGIASLDHAVARFASGYETRVGERGVTLSGGQKQRTAIAQMLLKDAPIMVFDDSLSAVDAQTDMKIRKALRERIAGATVILIAHRITTLMQADRIIVLDKGRVAEEGTHDELLAMGGIYRRIYDLQLAQDEE
ncbi:MAG: ABC transporter ATP-binding protein/permease [Lachnospiraceae bacterium]|nr:ABC transporter ATP-binding protein/permease [Lachnospiraceae bacterium]